MWEQFNVMNESKLIKIIENTEHLKNILIDWIVNN